MTGRPIALACALLCACALPSAAQSRPQEGIYTAVGNDAGLGNTLGRVQLRDQGTHFDVIREVRYAITPAPGGQPLTTVWIGVGVTRGAELHVTFPLSRMGWITEVGPLRRTLADQQPDVVTGVYRPDPSGGLSGSLTSPGGIAVVEALTRVGPAGAAPIHVDDREDVPAHGVIPGWLKPLLFSAFADYHTLPEIQPYVNRREFQAAVHFEWRDRMGFDWLRAHPGELLLTNKVVDAISLAEAETRRSAFGLRLWEKAAAYDRDAFDRHRYEGILAFGVRDDPSVPGGVQKAEDMSSWLWTGSYLYAQACRYHATRDPAVLADVEALAGRMCDMIEIDPRQGEFARSLRPIGAAPLAGSWHAGAGRFAHLAYHDNGNNDMIKGLWVGFLGAWEVLPATSPVRARMLAGVREIADHWATSNPSAAGGTGHRRDGPKNTLINNMLAFWMTGDPIYEQRYKAQFREWKLLAELAYGGNVAFYGISDWSGNNLGLNGKIAMVELARKLGDPWLPLFEHSTRMAYRMLHRYRQPVYSVIAAGLAGEARAADEVLWQLREFPYPKPRFAVDRQLDPLFCPSPFPNLPWKLDWMTNAGRKSSLRTYPVFMHAGNNYYYRTNPFDWGGGASGWEYGGGDYLFAYWMARKWGVIPAGE